MHGRTGNTHNDGIILHNGSTLGISHSGRIKLHTEKKKKRKKTLTAIYALAHYKKTTERQILNIYIIFKYLLHFTHTQKKHQHDNLI